LDVNVGGGRKSDDIRNAFYFLSGCRIVIAVEILEKKRLIYVM
jgi:hypothetical protein